MSLTLTIQGWFYLLTGLWPIISIKTFEMVTGPKQDKWLVKTVGLMIACSGIIFISMNDTKAALTLAILNAITLAGVDIYYAWKKVISRIYLWDALVELIFVLIYLWCI